MFFQKIINSLEYYNNSVIGIGIFLGFGYFVSIFSIITSAQNIFLGLDQTLIKQFLEILSLLIYFMIGILGLVHLSTSLKVVVDPFFNVFMALLYFLFLSITVINLVSPSFVFQGLFTSKVPLFGVNLVLIFGVPFVIILLMQIIISFIENNKIFKQGLS